MASKLDILVRAYGKNKGHSLKHHGFKSFEETGFIKQCYRCHLLLEIEKENMKADDKIMALEKEIEQYKEKVKVLTKGIERIKDHCLCHRNTYGFDYNEEHPNLGKPAVGKRWLTPRDICKNLIEI